MKRFFLGIVLLLSCLGLGQMVLADDVDYNISQYEGNLTIHEDNSADFVQVVTYHFESSYNGQILTLGEAGDMPEGFAVSANPEVEVAVNGQSISLGDSDVLVEAIDDGYQIKVYEAGVEGDDVSVTVHWQLANMLFPYQDVAELNWTPISDWDVTLENVSFTVTTDQTVADKSLWAHQGYLHETTVTEDDSGYHVTAQNVDTLELHAYWEASVLSQANWLSQTAKSDILAKEAAIIRTDNRIRFWGTKGLPIVLGILMLGSTLCFYLAQRKLRRYEKFNKKSRSYAAPEDWSPFVILSAIYATSVSDVVDETTVFGQTLDLEKTFQAALLDLIDRQILYIQDSYLIWDETKEVATYEREFLDMAFGTVQKRLITELFSDYTLNKNTIKSYKKKYSGSQLEKKLNALGSSFQSRYDDKLNRISEAVSQAITTKELPANYRSLRRREGVWLILPQLGLVVTVIFSIVAGLGLLSLDSLLCVIYLPYIFLAILLIVSFLKRYNHYLRHGVVTAEGHSTIQGWISFTTMLRDIHSFDRVGIEGVVVWNRILVYATLFGYAKRVEDYLTLHGIAISEGGLQLMDYQIAYLISRQTHYVMHSNQVAQSASHFSVSSGGTSSGGFSGGGGGGGGGAF